MKRCDVLYLGRQCHVAPPAGAWIETRRLLWLSYGFAWSPPLRGRGLKQSWGYSLLYVSPSRPPCGGVD